MKLNKANLEHFVIVGGQAEMWDRQDDTTLRGQVKAITQEHEGENALVMLHFSWLAKRVGIGKWKLDSTTNAIQLSAFYYTLSECGFGRIHLSTVLDDEYVMLYPKGDTPMLDPKDVEGL